jgi:hypothetical protein
VPGPYPGSAYPTSELAVALGAEHQSSRGGDVIGDLRDRQVASPHLLGKLGLAQTFQAEIELGHGKALYT